MRKLLIILAVSVLTTTGCSTKQARPSIPSTMQPNQPQATPSTPSAPSTTQPNQPSNTDKGNLGNGSSKPIPKPPSGSTTPLIITKQQYDHLNPNLTFGEVQKELGLGKLIKQTDHEAVYQYNGKNGGTVELTFWDGVLNSKSANDLK